MIANAAHAAHEAIKIRAISVFTFDCQMLTRIGSTLILFYSALFSAVYCLDNMRDAHAVVLDQLTWLA
jgi:hypothetical protein